MLLVFPSRLIPKNGQSVIDFGEIEPEAAVVLLSFKQESWPYSGVKGAFVEILYSLNDRDWYGHGFDLADERNTEAVVNASPAMGNQGLQRVPIPDESVVATCILDGVGRVGRKVRVVISAEVPLGLSGQIETLAFGRQPIPLPGVK